MTLPFDANRIHVAYEQFISWLRLLSYPYSNLSHGKIGALGWNSLGGNKMGRCKAMEHDIMGSTKPQN